MPTARRSAAKTAGRHGDRAPCGRTAVTRRTCRWDSSPRRSTSASRPCTRRRLRGGSNSPAFPSALRCSGRSAQRPSALPRRPRQPSPGQASSWRAPPWCGRTVRFDGTTCNRAPRRASPGKGGTSIAMPRVPTVRQADLDRVMKALKANGQGAARIEVRPGEVIIIPGALTDGEPSPHLSDLDAWRERKRGRSAS